MAFMGDRVVAGLVGCVGRRAGAATWAKFSATGNPATRENATPRSRYPKSVVGEFLLYVPPEYGSRPSTLKGGLNAKDERSRDQCHPRDHAATGVSAMDRRPGLYSGWSHRRCVPS